MSDLEPISKHLVRYLLGIKNGVTTEGAPRRSAVALREEAEIAEPALGLPVEGTVFRTGGMGKVAEE